MKAIAFAYYDIGCAGLVPLTEAGYDVQAVFTHTDDLVRENNFPPPGPFGRRMIHGLCAGRREPPAVWVDRTHNCSRT